MTFDEKKNIIINLYEKIVKFQGNWKEHIICLSLLMSKEVV